MRRYIIPLIGGIVLALIALVIENRLFHEDQYTFIQWLILVVVFAVFIQRDTQ